MTKLEYSISCLTIRSYKHTFITNKFERTKKILLDFSLSGRGLAISSAKEGKSGFIYNLVKS